MSWAKVEQGRLGGREVDVCLCPRCGGWPKFNRDYDGDLWYWFSCPDCGFVPGLRMFGTGSEALHAWNSGSEQEAERLAREAGAKVTEGSMAAGATTEGAHA